MRKKSHITLTNYLIKSMDVEGLRNYKKSFYVGSLWPDCMPSFITRKHCIEDTFYLVKREINKLTVEYNEENEITRYYCRHLGIITHYIADYFTFPHNHIFAGNLAEHCTYENELKYALKGYVATEEAILHREKVKRIRTVDEICDYIKELHKEYLESIINVVTDCEYIVRVCQKVVDIILQIFEICNATTNLKRKVA